MKVITEILQLQTSTYITLVYESYVAWCELYAHSPEQFQKMILNKQLYMWYMRTYKSLETQFLFEINKGNSNNFTTNELNEIYDNITMKIGTYYPAGILKSIQKNKRTKTIFNLN